MRVRIAKNGARTRCGTTVSIHTFHTGAAPNPPAQYKAMEANRPQVGSLPRQAPMISGRKAMACISTQTTHQRRYEPSHATARGETSCSTEPRSNGTEATNPETTSPSPKASANAGK